MEAKWLVGVAGMAVAATLAACSATTDEEVGGDYASVKQGEFDKNIVLTDADLRDTTSLSVTDIQAFLEATPWGQPSVLATYEEDGKSAAEILHDAAAKHGINPLELLVRAQMEQSLIHKETASEQSIALAFGCGCPHSPVCSSKYEGFANQADCAAGTLSRSMDRALTSNGTASGWKKGEGKLTQDQIEVVPANAATAALYTYTPWVGEAGGGRKGVGGASLHYQVWEHFADAIGYGATANSDGSRQSPELDAGTPDEALNDAGEVLNPTVDPEADAEAPSSADIDAGAPPNEDAPPNADVDAGTNEKDPRDPTGSNAREGTDDDDLLNEGNATPSTNAPPPREGTSRSKSSRGSSEDRAEGTDDELANKEPSSSGCSSTGGSTSDASLIGLAMATAAVVAKRRRRA